MTIQLNPVGVADIGPLHIDPADNPPAPVACFTSGGLSETAAKVHNKMLVILNPFSGNGMGRKSWETVRPIFEEAGIECDLRETKHARHATEIARQADLKQYDNVVAIGGDGTFHEVIQGLKSRDDEESIPLGLIPGGTGNSIVRSMEIFDPKVAAQHILRGKVKYVDLMKCDTESDGETYYAMNLVGYGLGVESNVTAEKLRRLGKARYDVAILWNIIKSKNHNVTLTLDGKEMPPQDLSMVLVQNNQHAGSELRTAPYAQMDDGVLDLLSFEHKSRWKILKAFDALKKGARHVHKDFVQYHRFRKLKIETPSPERINIDGENCGSTPITIEVMHRTLQLIV